MLGVSTVVARRVGADKNKGATMPREKENFREQLARLDELFPGREVITIVEASKLLGVYRATLLHDRTFPAKKIGETNKPMGGKYIVPKVALARWLA